MRKLLMLMCIGLLACEIPVAGNPTPCVQACVDTQLMLEPSMFTTSLSMQSDMQAQLDINMVAYPPGWAADMVITVENENYSDYWTEALANWANYNTQEIPMWYLISARAHLIADEPVDVECLPGNYCPRAEDWHVVVAVQDQYDLDWKCVEFGGQTSDVMYHWTCQSLTVALKNDTYDIINSARNLLTRDTVLLQVDTFGNNSGIREKSLNLNINGEPLYIYPVNCPPQSVCTVAELPTVEPETYRITGSIGGPDGVEQLPLTTVRYDQTAATIYCQGTCDVVQLD